MTDDRIVDLARERRLRALDERMADLMAENPRLTERTHAMLAGDLACPVVEDSMPGREGGQEESLALRLPSQLLARVDTMAETLKAYPEILAWGRPSRSAVIRLALARGLDAIEREIEQKDSR